VVQVPLHACGGASMRRGLAVFCLSTALVASLTSCEQAPAKKSPTVQEVLASPDFDSLKPAVQFHVLARVDPSLNELSEGARPLVLKKLKDTRSSPSEHKLDWRIVQDQFNWDGEFEAKLIRDLEACRAEKSAPAAQPRYQVFKSGMRSWRLDTTDGTSCLLLTLPGDMDDPRMKSLSCL
jgi:hypothetical protein